MIVVIYAPTSVSRAGDSHIFTTRTLKLPKVQGFVLPLVETKLQYQAKHRNQPFQLLTIINTALHQTIFSSTLLFAVVERS